MTDWEKDNTSRRTRQQHLSKDEVAEIKRLCREGARVRFIAEKFQCSMRVVQKYQSEVRGGYKRRSVRIEKLIEIKRPAPRPVINKAARFYHSDFEPS